MISQIAFIGKLRIITYSDLQVANAVESGN